jgi:hypothetical protein
MLPSQTAEPAAAEAGALVLPDMPRPATKFERVGAFLESRARQSPLWSQVVTRLQSVEPGATCWCRVVNPLVVAVLAPYVLRTRRALVLTQATRRMHIAFCDPFDNALSAVGILRKFDRDDQPRRVEAIQQACDVLVAPWRRTSRREEVTGHRSEVTICEAKRALAAADCFALHDLVVMHGTRTLEDAVRSAFPHAQLVLC